MASIDIEQSQNRSFTLHYSRRNLFVPRLCMPTLILSFDFSIWTVELIANDGNSREILLAGRGKLHGDQLVLGSVGASIGTAQTKILTNEIDSVLGRIIIPAAENLTRHRLSQLEKVCSGVITLWSGFIEKRIDLLHIDLFLRTVFLEPGQIIKHINPAAAVEEVIIT